VLDYVDRNQRKRGLASASLVPSASDNRMHKRTLLTMLAVPIAALTATAVLSQDKGSVDPKPLPPLVNPNDPELGAKELFGRKTSPAPLATHSIGFYDKGCLAGAEALPINGKTWQVMRPSRNRNWAHPDMVALLERLSVKAHEVAGWPGLLVEGRQPNAHAGPRQIRIVDDQGGPGERHG
jgi:penicillin-insensitive murein endopeptidase